MTEFTNKIMLSLKEFITEDFNISYEEKKFICSNLRDENFNEFDLILKINSVSILQDVVQDEVVPSVSFVVKFKRVCIVDEERFLKTKEKISNNIMKKDLQ